jgi:hypothetical protein
MGASPLFLPQIIYREGVVATKYKLSKIVEFQFWRYACKANMGRKQWFKAV